MPALPKQSWKRPEQETSVRLKLKSKSRSLQVCRMEHIDATASLSAVSSLTSIGVEKHNYLLKRVKQHQAQLRMICMQDFHIPFSFFFHSFPCLFSAIITAEETPGYPKRTGKSCMTKQKGVKRGQDFEKQQKSIAQPKHQAASFMPCSRSPCIPNKNNIMSVHRSSLLSRHNRYL